MADIGQSEHPQNTTENPNKNVDKVVTSRGSEYTYLLDGRTQRFKKATGELVPPQDVLVFIPPFDALAKQGSWSKYLQEKGIADKDTYEKVLLGFTKSGKTILVTDANGIEVANNKTAYELKAAGKGVFIQLINKDNGNYDQQYYFPVSVTPRIGWLTFDCRRYIEDGKNMHEKHIGNSVVDIKLKKQNAFTSVVAK